MHSGSKCGAICADMVEPSYVCNAATPVSDLGLAPLRDKRAPGSRSFSGSYLPSDEVMGCSILA